MGGAPPTPPARSSSASGVLVTTDTGAAFWYPGSPGLLCVDASQAGFGLVRAHRRLLGDDGPVEVLDRRVGVRRGDPPVVAPARGARRAAEIGRRQLARLRARGGMGHDMVILRLVLQAGRIHLHHHRTLDDGRACGRRPRPPPRASRAVPARDGDVPGDDQAEARLSSRQVPDGRILESLSRRVPDKEHGRDAAAPLRRGWSSAGPPHHPGNGPARCPRLSPIAVGYALVGVATPLSIGVRHILAALPDRGGHRQGRACPGRPPGGSAAGLRRRSPSSRWPRVPRRARSRSPGSTPSRAARGRAGGSWWTRRLNGGATSPT